MNWLASRRNQLQMQFLSAIDALVSFLRAGKSTVGCSRGSMQRLHVANDLPDLRISQLDPRRHTLAAIAIHQQPMQVSVGGLLLHACAFQRRPLPGSVSGVAVAVSTVVHKDAAAGGDGIQL